LVPESHLFEIHNPPSSSVLSATVRRAMRYRESERKKAIKIREILMRDPGDGLFFKKKREFVLQDAVLNLWAGIRMDAQDYFERNEIAWWMG